MQLTRSIVSNMLRTKLVNMIYEELYNELHKKGHKDPKGRKLMKGEEDLDENIDIEVANAPQWTKDLNSSFKEGGFFHDIFGAGDSPEAKKMEREMAFLDLQSNLSSAEKERQEADGVLALSKKGIPADKAKGVYEATLEAKKAAIQTKLLKKAINSKKFQKMSPEVQEKMTKNYEDNKKATEENFNSIADEYEKNGIKVPAAIQKSRGDSSKDAKGIKQTKSKATSTKTSSTKTTSASSTSGKKIVNPKTGKKIKATTAVSYGKGHPAYADAKKALGEATMNKSDAKYTMKIMFDNHGFAKALKHMKILRSGITLNMSSYMGPGKVLTKIVKDFNEVMGTKFKIDADSFQKGHVTSIELKEGMLNEKHPVDIVLAGIPARREGGIKNYQIITDPINDRQKSDMMKRAKKYRNMRAKPNMGGGITIHVKEGKVNEAKFTKVHAAKAMKLVKGTSVDKIIPKGDILYVNYTAYKDRAKIANALSKLYKYDNDGRSTNAPRGIIGLGGANWMSFVNESYVRDADTPGYFSPWSSEYKKDKKLKNEMSATARKHGKFGGTGVPFPTEEPNEFAYMDFAKYVKKNEKKMLKFLKPIRPDAMFKAMQDLWSGWDRKANKGAFSNIKGNKFGRELALMLRKDGLLFKNTGNKITNLKEQGMKLRKIAEATNLWKHFDAKMKLQDTIMDLEYDMKMINKDLSQLHKDMEQEAEPGGGKIADRYGRDIEKKEKEYKKKKAEFKKLMAKLEKMEMY